MNCIKLDAAEVPIRWITNNLPFPHNLDRLKSGNPEKIDLKKEKFSIKKRYTEQQIGSPSKQAETGVNVQEVARKMGISEATFYNENKCCSGLPGNGSFRDESLNASFIVEI